MANDSASSTSPRYRLTSWENKESHEVLHGIQCRAESEQWLNVTIKGTLLLYSDVTQAEKHLRWLNNPGATADEWDNESGLSLSA